MSVYDLKSIDLPRVAGASLAAVVKAVENPLFGGPIKKKMLSDVGFQTFRKTRAHAAPATWPLLPAADGEARDADVDLVSLAQLTTTDAPAGHAPAGIADYHRAYAEGAVSPVDVAERFLQLHVQAEEQTPRMRWLIAQDEDDLRAQAEASARRHQDGNALGVLDGVPVAVKDEVDQKGYPTTVGTSIYGAMGKKTSDAEAVRRLREQGALLVGKTNMHELGIGVTGVNPHHGTPRNPYDPSRCTGGSSSGSGAIVAGGMVPLALGADGGGSIRIPAALCGVVGLKPTFGRISEHGAAPLCWSVAHLGPMAWTARDCAVGYAVMAGPDAREPTTLRQGRVHVDDVGDTDLSHLTFGVFRPWVEHAEPGVVDAFDRALAQLKDRGAKVKRISIPGLDLVRLAHLVTIVGEMATSQLAESDKRQQLALDSRMNLALGQTLTATDYVHAQRHRTAITQQFLQLLDDVDAIVTPTTACTAVPLRDDALAQGESDLLTASRIMRYAAAGNLTGLPAISFPVGYDDAGLPVGMQLMGRPWEEAMLLQVAHAAEGFVGRRKPRVWLAPSLTA